MEPGRITHAFDRVDDWVGQWRAHGFIAVLLDFDGTLAPIVDTPDIATISAQTRSIVARLSEASGATVAIISGRAAVDARRRVGLEKIAYAGNHGMEIEAPGLHRVHPAARAARPSLDSIVEQLGPQLAAIPRAMLEDKGLTLSIHFRLVDRDLVPQVRTIVRQAVSRSDGLRVTEGKEVLEVRPDVDWDKGRAVDFLLQQFGAPAHAPAIYIGDDTTDEDAFVALTSHPAGAGVVVGDPPPATTAAAAFLRTPDEVARFLDRLVTGAASG